MILSTSGVVGNPSPAAGGIYFFTALTRSVRTGGFFVHTALYAEVTPPDDYDETPCTPQTKLLARQLVSVQISNDFTGLRASGVIINPYLQYRMTTVCVSVCRSSGVTRRGRLVTPPRVIMGLTSPPAARVEEGGKSHSRHVRVGVTKDPAAASHSLASLNISLRLT